MVVHALTFLMAFGSQAIDLTYSPIESEKYELVQNSYSIQEGSLVERVVFAFNVQHNKDEGSYVLKFEKRLVEHIFGEEKLDLPKSDEPIRMTEIRTLKGMWKSREIDPMHAGEHRLERLTAYFPPTIKLSVGSVWKVNIASNDDGTLPKIHYRFKLASVLGDSARISVEVKEVEHDNPLVAQGTFDVTLGKGKQRITTGSWTTESAFMPGGSEERFKLVQTIRSVAKS